jgi:hypothetical protein
MLPMLQDKLLLLQLNLLLHFHLIAVLMQILKKMLQKKLP